MIIKWCLSFAWLDLVWWYLGPSMFLQMALFHPFYGWVVLHCMYVPRLYHPSVDGHLGCFHVLVQPHFFRRKEVVTQCLVRWGSGHETSVIRKLLSRQGDTAQWLNCCRSGQEAESACGLASEEEVVSEIHTLESQEGWKRPENEASA